MEELKKKCWQVTIELCKEYPAFVDDMSKEAQWDEELASWLESLVEDGIVV